MTKFSDLKLDPKVLQAIAEAGYENPTPIQAGAIPPALEGRDVLGIAQTGTGKTASFTLPMITLLGRGRARARMPRSLVLCPTRELAAQVAENFDIYAKHTRLTKALLIGGVSFGEQDRLIDRGVDVLIATPGRLLDHFERGKLLLTGVQIMVVDEADRMLDMGFIPDIERIFQLTPFTRQTLFFSATMAPEIERITNTFLHTPERIEVARQATTSETITQKLVEITPTRKDQTAKQKRELLRALIAAEGEALKNAIIFCNRKTEVDVVAKSLKAHGLDAAPIHGDLDQRVRMATLDGFREGTLRLLIASDVAARGLDIPAVSHVFNFDLPSHAEDYVHRIGRTGRAGRLGTAISIATPSDEKYLSAIEALVKQALPRASLPEGFSLSDAAQSAPRDRAEAGGRDRGARDRTGSRVRTRNRRGDDADTPAAAPVARSVQSPGTAVPEERAAREPVVPNHGDARLPEAATAQPAPRADQGAGRPDARGDRRGRDRDRDRGPAFAGFGDSVPDFMTSNFADAIAVTEARAAEAQAAASRGPLAPAADPAAGPAGAVLDGGDASRPRGRTRRGRGRKAADGGAHAVPHGAGDTQASADDGPATAVSAAGNAPAATVAGDGPVSAEPPLSDTPEQPAKPARRARSAKARASDAADRSGPEPGTLNDAPAAETSAADTIPDQGKADAPAKPRRTRSRRKPDPAILPEEADATDPAMTIASDPEPQLTAEPMPADALPEERAAAAALDDGSLGEEHDGGQEPDAAAKPKRARAPRKPRAPAKAKAADAPVTDAAAGTDGPAGKPA